MQHIGNPKDGYENLPDDHLDAQECLEDRQDRDENNPVEMDADDWREFYAENPDYDIDHDHSMDY